MNILPDKQFGFCEFASVELGAAAVTHLDGVLFTSPSTGQFGNLRINRTNDYDPSKVGDMGPMPSIVLPPELTQKRGGGGSGGGASGSGGDRGSSVGPGGIIKGPVP